MTISTIINAIESGVLSEADLKILNSKVVSRLNGYLQERQLSALQAFKVGDLVQFETPRGIRKGKVEKINMKTVKIRVTDPQPEMWRVSPTVLRKAA